MKKSILLLFLAIMLISSISAQTYQQPTTYTNLNYQNPSYISGLPSTYYQPSVQQPPATNNPTSTNPNNPETPQQETPIIISDPDYGLNPQPTPEQTNPPVENPNKIIFSDQYGPKKPDLTSKEDVIKNWKEIEGLAPRPASDFPKTQLTSDLFGLFKRIGGETADENYDKYVKNNPLIPEDKKLAMKVSKELLPTPIDLATLGITFGAKGIFSIFKALEGLTKVERGVIGAKRVAIPATKTAEEIAKQFKIDAIEEARVYTWKSDKTKLNIELRNSDDEVLGSATFKIDPNIVKGQKVGYAETTIKDEFKDAGGEERLFSKFKDSKFFKNVDFVVSEPDPMIFKNIVEQKTAQGIPLDTARLQAATEMEKIWTRLGYEPAQVRVSEKYGQTRFIEIIWSPPGHKLEVYQIPKNAKVYGADHITTNPKFLEEVLVPVQ